MLSSRPHPIPATSAQPKPEKRHAACDECRGRKLKCTGHRPSCQRCIAENTICVYSLQKPMGRPRKRKKEFDEDHDTEIEVVSTPMRTTNAARSIAGSGSVLPRFGNDDSTLAAPSAPTLFANRPFDRTPHRAQPPFNGYPRPPPLTKPPSAPAQAHRNSLHKQPLSFNSYDGSGPDDGFAPHLGHRQHYNQNFYPLTPDYSTAERAFSQQQQQQQQQQHPLQPPPSTFQARNMSNSSMRMAPPPPIHTPFNKPRGMYENNNVTVPLSAGSMSSTRPSPASSSSSPSMWSPPNTNFSDNQVETPATAINDLFPVHPDLTIKPVTFTFGLMDACPMQANPRLEHPLTPPSSLDSSLIRQSPPLTDGDDPGQSGLPNQSFIDLMPAQMNSECACLSSSYLASSMLHPATNYFPVSLIPIKKAIITATQMLECQACPRMPGTAMQNMFTLSTLLTSVVDQVRKVLDSIEDEALQAAATGRTKRVGPVEDRANPTFDMFRIVNGGGPGLFYDISADEWGALARLFVRNHVVGSLGRPETLVFVLDRLKSRQESWHATKKRTENLLGLFAKCVADENGDFMCYKMIRMVQGMVDVLKC